MTLPEAHETARSGADRFGNTWRVFRLPLWPAAVYGCKAGELPAEAVVLETYPKLEVRSQKFEPVAAADPQGSLF